MPHKAYVDSRRRCQGTSSNFAYQFASVFQVPQSRAYIAAVSLSNVLGGMVKPSKSGTRNSVVMRCLCVRCSL